MSVVAIPILNKNYAMGCEDGQEMRLVEIGKFVNARAHEIKNKIGNLPDNSLLATLCIVLADEIMSRDKNDAVALEKILNRIHKER